MTSVQVRAERPAAVRRARQLNALTIGWNVIEGVAAITAGILAGSLSLIGFGLDSGIEVSAALVLTWRLAQEGNNGCTDVADQRAQRGIALSFGALALYILVSATIAVSSGQRPEASIIGIAIALLSLLVMPAIAHAKRRVAADLGSRAARAEASQTDLCTMLSAALLVGLAANAAFDWWWADSTAALGIGIAAAWMAARTWNAESLQDTCCA